MDMKRITTIAGLAVAAAIAPGLAFAHTGQGEASGLAHGFLHPVGGLDHILAMATVGLFAALLGGRALWVVPASFVLMMAAGGVLGMTGFEPPFVELGIAASIIVLGAAVALNRPAPLYAAMALVGFFATFHGFAHGTEMPAGASGLAYALGFMAATASLHAAGVALGLLLQRALPPAAIRLAGGAVAAIGLAILAG
jgi:urease accessory protein